MAGDWIPFDHDFPEKPEALAIFEATEVPIGEIMLRLHRLWRTADRQTSDGHLHGVGVKALAISCGGDLAFWSAVQKVGWLGVADDGHVFVPRFVERFGKSARERMLDAKRNRRNRRAGRKPDAHPDANRTETGRGPDGAPDKTGAQNHYHYQYQNQYKNQEEPPSEVCSEPEQASASPPAERVVMGFPCTGKGPREWELTEAKLAEYREAFPALDVLAEFRCALQWVRDNPGKRKTASGMPRYLTAWLTRSQNRGVGGRHTEASSNPFAKPFLENLDED